MAAGSSVSSRSRATNSIHGSVFEFVRNRDFDANDYFNKQQDIPRLDLKRNQFGATLGGPIVKDKTFFFLAYQGQRQNQAYPLIDPPVYTPQELQGNFSEAERRRRCLCTQRGVPGSRCSGVSDGESMVFDSQWERANAIIDPTKIDPMAQNYIKAGLIPSAPNGLLSTTLEAQDNRNELTSKIDFNLSAKDKISATFGLNRAGDPLHRDL